MVLATPSAWKGHRRHLLIPMNPSKRFRLGWNFHLGLRLRPTTSTASSDSFVVSGPTRRRRFSTPTVSWPWKTGLGRRRRISGRRGRATSFSRGSFFPNCWNGSISSHRLVYSWSMESVINRRWRLVSAPIGKLDGLYSKKKVFSQKTGAS